MAPRAITGILPRLLASGRLRQAETELLIESDRRSIMDQRARQRIATWPMSRDPLIRVHALVDLSETLELIEQQKALGNRITVTAVAARAAAIAMRAEPRVNSRIFLGRMTARTDQLVGCVVGLDAGQLVLCRIADADRGTLLDTARGLAAGIEEAASLRPVPPMPTALPAPIARRVTSVVRAARSLTGRYVTAPVVVTTLPHDRTRNRVGATSVPFVPHLHATVAINLGAIHDGVVARDGIPTVTKAMWVGLTYDHRVVDGVESLRFQNAFVDAMEHAPEFSGLHEFSSKTK